MRNCFNGVFPLPPWWWEVGGLIVKKLHVNGFILSWLLLLALEMKTVLRRGLVYACCPDMISNVSFHLKSVCLDNLYDHANSSQSSRGTRDFPTETETETTGSGVQLVRATQTNPGSGDFGCCVRWDSGPKDLFKFTLDCQPAHLQADIVIIEVSEVGGFGLGKCFNSRWLCSLKKDITDRKIKC